jgi:hypothetical protein
MPDLPVLPDFRFTPSVFRTNDPVEVIQTHEDLAGFRTVRRSQHTRGMELVDDARGPAVTDAEPALQQGRRA